MNLLSPFFRIPCLLLLVATWFHLIAYSEETDEYAAANQKMRGIRAEFEDVRNRSLLEALDLLGKIRQDEDTDLVNRLRVAYEEVKLLIDCKGNGSALELLNEVISNPIYADNQDEMIQIQLDVLKAWRTYIAELKTDYAANTATYKRILPFFKKHALPYEVVNLYDNIAYDYMMVDRPREGLAMLQLAREYALERGDRQLVSIVDTLMGNFKMVSGEDDSLVDNLLRAADYFRQEEDSYNLLKANIRILSGVSVISGEEFRELVNENIALAKELNAPGLIFVLVQMKSRFLGREGDFIGAIECVREGILYAKEQGSEEAQMWMKTAFVEYMLNSEEPRYLSRVKQLLPELMEWAESVEDTFFVSQLKMSQVKLFVSEGKFNEANVVLEDAIKFYREIDFKSHLHGSLCLKAEVDAALFNYESAYQYLSEAKAIKKNLDDGRSLKEQSRISYKLRKSERENELKIQRIENELNQTKIREQELELQNERRKVSEAYLKQQILYLALFIAIVLIVLVIVVYSRKLRSEKELKLLTQELEREHGELIREQQLNKEMNRELRASIARMRELDEQRKEIMGIVAHDMKNPIASVENLIGFCFEDLKDSSYARLERHLTLSQRSIHYLNELVQRILKARKMEKMMDHYDIRWFDPTPIIEQMIAMNHDWARSKGMVIESRFEQSCHIFCDSQSFREIVDNLLSNAIKYSNKDAKITVYSELCEEELILSIHDGGPGLTENDFKGLFLPFSKLSAKPTGGEASSGLGLSSVKIAVDAMKGKVEVANHEDGGAVFSVHFPAK